MSELKSLGYEDIQAASYLHNNQVHMKAAYDTDGNILFYGSKVEEDRREGELTPSFSNPRFVLRTDGEVREVGCNCAHWKVNKEDKSIGGPCAHLRALWLKYCQEIERLREAKDAGENTGPVRHDSVHLKKGSEERIINFDVRNKYIFHERWKRKGMTDFRQSTQVYTTEEAVRQAFAERQHFLTCRGFEFVTA